MTLKPFLKVFTLFAYEILESRFSILFRRKFGIEPEEFLELPWTIKMPFYDSRTKMGINQFFFDKHRKLTFFLLS